MGHRSLLLAWITLLSASIFLVTGEVIWTRDLDGYVVKEPKGDDYITLPGNRNFESNWTEITIEDTLEAIDSETGGTEGIIIGFNNAADPNDITVSPTSNYFRINETTGEVYMFGSRLDYENENHRIIKMELIARKVNTTQANKRTVTWTVEDVNDNRPKFTNDSLSYTIEENYMQPRGILALRNIVVTDADKSPTGQRFLSGGIDYCVVTVDVSEECLDNFKLVQRGNDAKRFAFDFFVMRPLDYELYGSFQVQITVTDGYFETTSDININVVDMQDLPPRWIEIDKSAVVYDGTLPEELNITVFAKDQDTGNRDIYYTLLPTMVDGIYVTDVFAIDSFKGAITNIIELDLENETYFRNYTDRLVRFNWPLRILACEILETLELGTGPENCAPVGDILIEILDINDNRPEHILRNIYYFEIDENEPIGSIPEGLPFVIFDRDTELYNKHKSILLTPSDEFEIGGTDQDPVLQVKKLLDYDRGPKEYNLTILTYDIDDDSLFSIAYAIINIRGINDNRPLFREPIYRKSIPEDSRDGDVVVTIQADDIDANEFGTIGIIYELIGPYSNLFEIGLSSGIVTVAECDTYGVKPCLDYDFPPIRYSLTVRARDNNGKEGNSNSNTVPLIVTLLDVNDNRPTVPNYDRRITEGERTFDPVLNVTGSDRDSNTVLVYAIESQSSGNFWKIDSRTGVITVNKPGNEGIKYTDGDITGRFELLVKVTDGKFDAFSRVTITVIDINDNAPYFFPTAYEVFINESTPGGTFILQVTAFDEDDPTSVNGILQYSFLKNIGGEFFIDQVTGDIYTSIDAEFDFDVTKRYDLIVEVSDRGQPTLSSNASVVVHILDNNNKNPVIDPFQQEFTVFDNVAVGFPVGTVNARDPDLDALLVFEWFGVKEASSNEGYVVNPETGFDFRNLFVIERTTGVIRVNEPLDSRRAAIVSYGVRVTDIRAVPVQHGPGSVVIFIRPYNTKRPVFDPFDSPIYIDEEQPIGSVVISLVAQDDNAIRIFEIEEQPEDNFVTINPVTGSVTIRNRIDYDDARRLNGTYFKAIAIDTGEPPLTATATVSLIFRNINDNFPVFVDPVRGTPVNIYTARIPENSPDGTPIGTAYAFDIDRPDNNTFDEIRYYMNDSRFDVDPITGEMFVRLLDGAVLDREREGRINTRVIARDNPIGTRENQNQRAASVQITLTDENDNCPQFLSTQQYSVTVFETIGVGTDILQLFITDRDIGNNAKSYYSKIPNEGTDYLDFFDVRRESGRVYVKRSLVRYTGTYEFYAEATDNLGQGCTTNTTVIVTVLLSANVPPFWVIPPIDNMTIYVLEEQYNGMVVYDVFARDEDSGRNGHVDYSFIYNGEQTEKTPEFKINKVTGVIQAEIVYDREKIDKYVLLLKAQDRGETPLETTRFLTVIILDVNDNKPVFAEREFQVDILENQPLGDIKQIPSATDKDLDPLIVYDIISGNEDEVFELDRYTRMLRLVKPLNRETKSIYYIDVLASNDEIDYTVIVNRRRRSVDPGILKMKVIVGDINDLAPAFLQDEYYGCVSARSPYDKHILTVQAIDRDAIGTGVVRYMVTDGNKIGNVTLFDIHPKFGVITNKVLMRRYADSTFFVTVNARDREDVETAESANTVAKIFVHQPGNEVKLLITQNTAEVRLYQTQIQSILEEATDLSYVCINDIQDHVVDSVGSVTTLWSDVYITGVRRVIVNEDDERFIMLTNTELKNIVDRERYDRKSDFDLLYIKEVEAASSSQEIELEDQAVLIILIIIAVLIFLVIIFCIVAFLCIRAAKHQKKALLLHRTHATPPAIIQPEPVIVEPVVYDNRAYVVEEQQPVVVEDQQVIEHDPVHVQYAVVQKRSPSPAVFEDDQDAIVVELKADEPTPQVVHEIEGEYRIETEVVTDAERI